MSETKMLVLCRGSYEYEIVSFFPESSRARLDEICRLCSDLFYQEVEPGDLATYAAIVPPSDGDVFYTAEIKRDGDRMHRWESEPYKFDLTLRPEYAKLHETERRWRLHVGRRCKSEQEFVFFVLALRASILDGTAVEGVDYTRTGQYQ